MKQFFAVLACAVIALLAAACGDAGTGTEYTIGISIPSADHGWTGGVVSWAETAKADIERENPGVKVIITTAQSSEEQVKGIENMLMRGIDVLVCLPCDPKTLTQACDNVKQSGVKLVIVDRGLTDDKLPDLEVVGDNYGFGKACGEVLAKELNGQGDIVVMTGIPCDVDNYRVKGFQDAIAAYPGINVMQYERADWNEEKGYKIMELMIQKYAKIDAVWAGDDDVLAGALEAYSKAGRSDVKIMIGGGGSKAMVKRVMDGDPLVRLTVTYPPKMIYIAALEAVKMAGGEIPAEKRMVIPADVVRRDNAAAFYYPESRY